jgi:hypothetical protein
MLINYLLFDERPFQLIHVRVIIIDKPFVGLDHRVK